MLVNVDRMLLVFTVTPNEHKITVSCQPDMMNDMKCYDDSVLSTTFMYVMISNWKKHLDKEISLYSTPTTRSGSLYEHISGLCRGVASNRVKIEKKSHENIRRIYI